MIEAMLRQLVGKKLFSTGWFLDVKCVQVYQITTTFKICLVLYLMENLKRL